MNDAIGAEMIGGLAGALTTISFVPQVLKVVRTRSTQDISLATFMLFSTGVFFWLCYGLLIGSLSVIIANCFTLILSLTILSYKWREARRLRSALSKR